jgi:hypothetical protein
MSHIAVEPSQTRSNRRWMNSGALIVAPMVAVLVIPSAVDWLSTVRFIAPLNTWVDAGYSLPFAILATIYVVLFAPTLCVFTIWLATLGVGSVLSEMRFDRERAFALTGIGLLSSSFAMLLIPSHFPEDLKAPTFSVELVWIPAGVLVLASLAAFIRARALAWCSLFYLPLVPLVAVSLHENVWYPHPNLCPAFWLEYFQGPWVLVGFLVAYIGLLAIAAQAWRKEVKDVKGSAITVAVGVVLVLFIELLGATEYTFRWFKATWVLIVFLTASVGILAVVARVWRREAFRGNQSALTSAVMLPLALFAGLLIFGGSQLIRVADCGHPTLRHLVGPFFW